jgi:hypothetical protein
VALDAATHKPVLLAPPQGPQLRITAIETLDFAPADFRRPTPDETPLLPSRGDARDDRQLALDGAAIAAARPGALWPGPQVGGLPLVRAAAQTLVTAWPDGRPPATGRGLELEYGSLTANGHRDRTKPYVTVSQAPSPELATAYMWSAHDALPAPGTLLSEGSPGFAVGFLAAGGGVVGIQASSDDLLLAAARSLAPAR